MGRHKTRSRPRGETQRTAPLSRQAMTSPTLSAATKRANAVEQRERVMTRPMTAKEPQRLGNTWETAPQRVAQSQTQTRVLDRSHSQSTHAHATLATMTGAHSSVHPARAETNAHRGGSEQESPAARATRVTWLNAHKASVGWWLGVAALTVFAALLSGLSGLNAQFGGGMANLGFDAERITLLTQCFVAFMSATVASLILRRRAIALLTSSAFFVVQYIIPFIAQALHPALGPANEQQTLIPSALVMATLTILALAVVCAGLGAAVGGAGHDLFIAPTLVLWQRMIRRRHRNPQRERAQVSMAHPLWTLALGGFIIGTIIISAAGGAATILTYGPTTNLYALDPHGAIPHGQLLHETYNSPSLGNKQRQFWIYLPPSYATAKGLRYPTLYMLHGAPGTPYEWFGATHLDTIADALIAAGKMRETIIVGADGNGPTYRYSEWANSLDGKQMMENAIAFDLVHMIDMKFRTLANSADRAIGGLSEGGYGAANIALHHPTVFGTAFSVSGYFEAEGWVFGSGPESISDRAYNSPSAYIKTTDGRQALSQIKLIIAVGTSDGFYFSDSQNFYDDVLSLHGHALLMKNSGGHSWRVWAAAIGQALPILEPPAKVASAA